MLEETNSGFWVEAGNTALLKEKLMLLYNDGELRAKLGANGYKYMAENLLPNHAYKRILDNF